MLLSVVSLLTLFSITWEGEGGFGNSVIFQKQLGFTFLGIILLLLFSLIDYRLFYNYNKVFYFFTLFLLIAVFLFGSRIKGASSWFRIGSYGFEPVELAKISIIIILAKYLDIYAYKLYKLKYIIISLIPVLVLMFLTFIQPDLGSFAIIGFIWIGMITVSGLKKKHLAMILLTLLITSMIGWTFFLRDYQKHRLLSFVNPEEDPLGTGYNLLQSMIAVGSGGFFGKGLGQGSQSQLQFLPEEHTDFIFAVIAEEWGFLGVTLVLAIFSFILFRIIKISLSSKNNFGRMIGVGAALMIFFQVIVNVGMNIGVLPITGIPLPFISYGGSALVSLFMLMGILQSIYIHNRYKELG